MSANHLTEKASAISTLCDCGMSINTDMPYVESDARVGVLWHGNAEGGGHSSDFDRASTVSAVRT